MGMAHAYDEAEFFQDLVRAVDEVPKALLTKYPDISKYGTIAIEVVPILTRDTKYAALVVAGIPGGG